MNPLASLIKNKQDRMAVITLTIIIGGLTAFHYYNQIRLSKLNIKLANMKIDELESKRR